MSNLSFPLEITGDELKGVKLKTCLEAGTAAAGVPKPTDAAMEGDKQQPEHGHLHHSIHRDHQPAALAPGRAAQ